MDRLLNQSSTEDDAGEDSAEEEEEEEGEAAAGARAEVAMCRQGVDGAEASGELAEEEGEVEVAREVSRRMQGVEGRRSVKREVGYLTVMHDIGRRTRDDECAESRGRVEVRRTGRAALIAGAAAVAVTADNDDDNERTVGLRRGR